MKLRNLEIVEVSLVDRAANKRKFLVVKRLKEAAGERQRSLDRILARLERAGRDLYEFSQALRPDGRLSTRPKEGL